MQPLPQRVRSLAELCQRASATRFTGDLVVQCDAEREHRVVFRHGVVVDVSPSGDFDPILTRLLEEGALSASAFVEALEALGRSRRRAGDLALDRGVPRTALRRALAAQAERRFSAIVELARAEGREAWLAPRDVAPRDVRFHLDPLSFFVKHGASRAPGRVPSTKSTRTRKPVDRRAFRRLAFALHPDRHPHLSDAEKKALARRLAAVTAAFHGL